jgi:hypothetical protein
MIAEVWLVIPQPADGDDSVDLSGEHMIHEAVPIHPLP